MRRIVARSYRWIVVGVVCALMSEARLAAYIGPGAGVSVLGTVVAFLGAVFFAIVGFVWYPLKRLAAVVRRATARRKDATG